MLPECTNLDFGVIENLSEPPADLSSRFEGCHYLIHCASPVILGGAGSEVRGGGRGEREGGRGGKWNIFFYCCLFALFLYIQEEVVKPAVEGTKKVMAACLDAKIRRVVLTASMASICGSQRK